MAAKELKKQLISLREFLDKDTYSAEEIVDWVSGCVAFFSAIGVSDVIVSGFMKSFEYTEHAAANTMIIFSTNIGPFIGDLDTKVYRKKEDWTYLSKGNIHSETIYLKIAFKTAESIISNFEEAQRLVPKSLVAFFSEKPEFSQIYSSLVLLEQNFKDRDSISLATNAIALLGSILNLETSLVGRDLSNQLRQLQSNASTIAKFGVRGEVIFALDNSRILRNHLASHKNVPIEYNVPFAVALGTAYLIIMFLQITMATGILIT